MIRSAEYAGLPLALFALRNRSGMFYNLKSIQKPNYDQIQINRSDIIHSYPSDYA